MADAGSDNGSDSVTSEEEDVVEPSLSDMMDAWVKHEWDNGNNQSMGDSMNLHQGNSRYRCQQSRGQECCDPTVGCQKAALISSREAAKFEERKKIHEAAVIEQRTAVKQRKLMPLKAALTSNGVFSDIFGRDLTSNIQCLHAAVESNGEITLHRGLKLIEGSTDAIRPGSQKVVKDNGNTKFERTEGERLPMKFAARSMVDGQTEQYLNNFWSGQALVHSYRFASQKNKTLMAVSDTVHPNIGPRRTTHRSTNPLHTREDRYYSSIWYSLAR